MRWTQSDIETALAKTKPHKYSAKRVIIDGIDFDSKKEGARYSELRLMEKASKIDNLRIHPRFSIDYNNIHICDVELDFKYYDKELGRIRYEDTKGVDTPMSKLKRKLLQAFFHIDVEIL